MGSSEGLFVGNKVLGEKVTSRFVGMCVVGGNEGEKLLGMLVGWYVGLKVVGIWVGGEEGFSVGNKVVGEKVSPDIVGMFVTGRNVGETVFGMFVGLYDGKIVVGIWVGGEEGIFVGNFVVGVNVPSRVDGKLVIGTIVGIKV